MTITMDPVQDTDLCPRNFWNFEDQIGFVDLRKKAKEKSLELMHHLLLERPCGKGAVPPSLVDEYDKADEKQKASIAYKYAGYGYGVDAYIVQLRMQIAHGIKTQCGLHERIREFKGNKYTAAFAIWNLAHHHFGQDPDSDLKIKGCILWLMNGQKSVDKIHQNTMSGIEGLAAKIAYPLMFDRDELALIRPMALHAKSPAAGEVTWETVELPLDKVPIVHHWDGSVRLEDKLNSVLSTNFATVCPELAKPPETRWILARFNKPLLIPVRYECSRELASPMTIRDMRSFRLDDRTPRLAGPTGTTPAQVKDVYYRLCAVVNLETDDVRLYGPRTLPLTERPPPDMGDAGQQRDTGGWNLGQRETKFLLWYRREDLGDGETYKPPIEDAREFVSIKEHDDDCRMVGMEPQFSF